ncbi:MAG: hypothetical protein IPK73_14665 [Candidatus Obscuribacter sp.]|nr:hypothetical protein [Candidatus Obscuribacter sp.]MBK9282293.1 hypothetical protein [Candidatus Obscuribacter sp.]
MKSSLYLFWQRFCHSSLSPLEVLTCLLLSLLLAQTIIHQASIDTDMAVNLSTAMALLDGSRLYLDNFNPAWPPALFLILPASALARTLHIYPVLILKLFFYLLACLAILAMMWSVRLRRAAALESCLLPLAAPFSAAFLLLTSAQFVGLENFPNGGQFYPLMVLPLLILQAKDNPRPEAPPALSALTYFLAAAAICFEPSFVLYYLLLVSFPGLKNLMRNCLPLLLPIFLLLIFAVSYEGAWQNYLDWSVLINQLNFLGFNDYLYWMDKSPDLRKPVYGFVMLLVLSAPLLVRSALSRRLAALACFGFAYFISSQTLLGQFTLPMLFFAGLNGLGALVFLCRVFLHGPLRKLRLLSRRLSAEPTILICLLLLAGSSFLQLLSREETVTIDDGAGTRAVVRSSDLSIFARTVLNESRAGEPIYVYCWQARPGFPLTAQLMRKTSRFPYLYPFMAFHHGGAEASACGVLNDPERLPRLESKFYSLLQSELSAAGRPALIFIEDGDIRQQFDDRGLVKLLDSDYSMLASFTFSPEERKGHPSFEYPGYMNAFAAFKHR